MLRERRLLLHQFRQRRRVGDVLSGGDPVLVGLLREAATSPPMLWNAFAVISVDRANASRLCWLKVLRPCRRWETFAIFSPSDFCVSAVRLTAFALASLSPIRLRSTASLPASTAAFFASVATSVARFFTSSPAFLASSAALRAVAGVVIVSCSIGCGFATIGRNHDAAAQQGLMLQYSK